MNAKNLLIVFVVGCKHSVSVESVPVPSASAVVAWVSEASVQVPEASASPEPPKEHLLAGFTTKFKTDTKDGRVDNITLVVSKINDAVIQPGEEFSFNRLVGPRTAERGFKDAPTIVMGEIFEGIGGGTCQVSSTLYTAALWAGLEIKERRPHSRPSSYISPGLDATVSYPAECETKADPTVCYDLKFKNNYDFPIRIRTGIGEIPVSDNAKQSLTVALWGTGTTPRVDTEWQAWNAPPFEKRHRRVPYWKDDRQKLKQSGAAGLEGALLVTTTYPDGHKATNRIFSHYSPVPEVWEVGMDWKDPGASNQ